ncbi:phosphotransferase family protein [Pseudonocardia sp. NPDC049635]|uniref:phosphotransferase family protein n=1 Tax=Pseudonocardia sp. NPDC049635 TaxID=3155506 RepID=UPI0033D5BDDE
MTTSARTPTPGADPAAVGGWLATVLDDERWTAAELVPIGAGRSNLTYRVDSPAGSVVLRRPPVGQVAATAHDMGREQRVIAALAGTEVPVPAVLATYGGPGSPDGADGPTDAPCFVMELVDGVVPLDDLPDGWASSPDDRRRAGEALVDVLATLHAVDPAEVGLADFGRPEGFMERQIRRWGRQWAAARDGDDPVPVEEAVEADLTRLAERLAADVPAAQRHTIVHGDYRLDNCVFDATDPGRILAVLDWEMSTLGDPLADVGLLLVYWKQAGDAGIWADAQPLPGPTSLPGFPTRRELVAAYAARTGIDPAPLPWYVAFGAFKLAVVLAGILARVRAGSVPAQMAEGLEGSVGPLVALGHHLLDGGRF